MEATKYCGAQKGADIERRETTFQLSRKGADMNFEVSSLGGVAWSDMGVVTQVGLLDGEDVKRIEDALGGDEDRAD
jgi:hypothetical protein